MNWYKLTNRVLPGVKTLVLRNFVSTVIFSMICGKLRFIVALKYDSKCKFVIELFVFG